MQIPTAHKDLQATGVQARGLDTTERVRVSVGRMKRTSYTRMFNTPITLSYLLLLKSVLLPLLLQDAPHSVLIRVPKETPCVPIFELQIHIYVHELLLSRFQKVKSLPLYIVNIVVFIYSRSEEPLANLFLIYRVEGKIISRSVYSPKVSTLLTI